MGARKRIAWVGWLALIGAGQFTPALCAACASAPESLPFSAPDLKLGFGPGAALTVYDGDQEALIPGVEVLAQEFRDGPCLLSVQRRNGAYFVVFSVTRWTNGEPGGGECGAGVESEVHWLQIAQGKLVVDSQVRFDSCSLSREGDFSWVGTTLRVSTNDTIDDDAIPHETFWRDLVWTFDATRPELGLVQHTGALRSAERPH